MTSELQQAGKANNISFYIKRTIGVILLLAVAAVFLFSAYSKIHSSNAFDAFQWTFFDLGINSTTFAGVLARLVIGFEFLLGLFLICHIFLKSVTYPCIIILLSMFVVYLLIVLIRHGNTGSCGCFGDIDQVKPLTELWRDLLLIGATVALIYIYPVKPYKNQEWIGPTLGMAALVAPFLLMPMDANNEPVKTYQAINLDPLYQVTPAPSAELRKGKHIVAFMSLTCPHCKKAAYLLQIIHSAHPSFPIFLVLNGPAAEEQNFFKETHADSIPHVYFKNTPLFISMSGASVPAIYWINNSITERTSTYYQLDPRYMQQWLK